MKKTFLIFIALLLVTVSPCAASIKDIFSGDQDYLILGTVKDVSDGNITVTVDNTVGDKAPSILGTDITVDKFTYSYCEEHTPSDFNQPKIGDNIFASVNADGDSYTVQNGAYKVDSSEIKNCSTIVYTDMSGEECLMECVQIAYFIRTNGKMTKYVSEDDGKVYAVSDDDKILIYPLPDEQCVKFVDDSGKTVDEEPEQDVMPITPPTAQAAAINDKRWIYALLIIFGGFAAGFVAFYFFYAKKRL